MKDLSFLRQKNNEAKIVYFVGNEINKVEDDIVWKAEKLLSCSEEISWRYWMNLEVAALIYTR